MQSRHAVFSYIRIDFYFRNVILIVGPDPHRRSQEGGHGTMPPRKFLKYLVILCFERRYSRQNAVASLK